MKPQDKSPNDTALTLLAEALALHNLGYNECHAETCPRQRDGTGKTALQYRREAEALTRKIQRFLTKAGQHIPDKYLEAIVFKGKVLTASHFHHLSNCQVCAQALDRKMKVAQATEAALTPDVLTALRRTLQPK